MLTEDPSQPLLVSHNLILSLNPSLSKTLEDTTKRLEKVTASIFYPCPPYCSLSHTTVLSLSLPSTPLSTPPSVVWFRSLCRSRVVDYRRYPHSSSPLPSRQLFHAEGLEESSKNMSVTSQLRCEERAASSGEFLEVRRALLHDISLLTSFASLLPETSLPPTLLGRGENNVDEK